MKHEQQPSPRLASRLLSLATAAFSLLTIFLLVCSTASAQLAGKGTISGKVADPTGATVPGATVVITRDANNASVTTTSTSSGDYSVTTLDPGVYTVTVTAGGFQKLIQKNVQVNALETQTFNAQLTVGSATQEVTVSSAPPQLETANATLGATLEQETYSALPLEMGGYGQPDQRRATDFVFLFPGVQGNNTSGNATTNAGIVNGSGARGAVTGTYVDGISFTRAGGNGDPRYVWTAISVDAIDQLQVQTVGYSAIYEGQGVQNYNIKQGGTKYHGTVYEFFRNTALDTFGFFPVVNPVTQAITKPVEHSNEYGIALSGPLVPFGKLKEKLFFFGNYNGFRFINQKPTAMTFPTAAQQVGNFQGVLNSNTGAELGFVATLNGANLANTSTCPTTGTLCVPAVGVYDPNTQTACTANSTTGPCRYRYGYIGGGTAGAFGNPVLPTPGNTTGVDMIPSGQFSAVALKAQSFLPAGIGNTTQNNYIAPNRNGLTNWSTTDRIDFILSEKHTMSGLVALGRQASSVPAGQSTAGRNVGPLPYNYGQTFTPKTAVGIVEDTYIVSPHLVNQLKFGYARYDGPTYDADQAPGFSATTLGINGAPAGQASGAFPIVTFAGTNAPTGFAGVTANRVIAQNYTLLDNVQYVKGRHSITIGGQIAWLNYDQSPATGGSTPLTLATAVTETAALNASTNAKPSYAPTASTGLAYASFLIGQIDKTTYTQYLVQEFGSRFRAISPYIQDNWKITDKLTLDLGLRYDYFPPLRENKDDQSFFSPTLANPVTGVNGALQFAGHGAGTCNCSGPFNTYWKNIGPRLGLAYQVDANTVLRASYGVMYTHGNGVAGSNESVTGSASNSLGFSSTPTFSSSGTLLSTAPFTGANGTLPAGAVASGRASGPQFGTGFTTTAGYTGTPSSMAYYDPYLGGRAPQFINYSLGLQHQWNNFLTTTMSYVGSQGHFLLTDGTNGRGFFADQLDPKYLPLGLALNATGAALQTTCAANNLPCPANFSTSKAVSDALKPFPFQSVSDFDYNIGNTNYNSLQVVANMRLNHHLTFMANYTWSRSIDDAGTFRSGYALPAGSVYNNPKAYAQDAIERTVSNVNQPHKVVVTGVYELPFGRDILASHAWERAAFGGFKFSEIFQAFSGSPLAITGASCGANPAQGTCMASYAPAFTNPNNVRINGKHWGQGVTRTNYNQTSFVDSTAFVNTPAYVFGNTSRTAPYGLTGPGNYNVDIALVRSFKLYFTEAARFDFRAELYNVTNHTQFQVSGNSLIFGNSSFGQVTGTQANAPRSAQLSGRISF